MSSSLSPLHLAGKNPGATRLSGIKPHLPPADTFAAGLVAAAKASGQMDALTGPTAAGTNPASASGTAASGNSAAPNAQHDPQLRQAFDQFVGETFYGQMLKSLRSTSKKPAYFNGGRAEEVFTGQLDQVLAEKISHSKAQQISQPMFNLYNLQRK